MDSAIRYDQHALWIAHDGRTSRIHAAAIIAVLECQMQDEVLHADEYCHILRLQDTFWLIGPFVDGAPRAIYAFLHAHPEHRLERTALSNMPFRMRAPGLLGLRIWPIAGLGHYPIAQLTQLTRIEHPRQPAPLTAPCPARPRS